MTSSNCLRRRDGPFGSASRATFGASAFLSPPLPLASLAGFAAPWSPFGAFSAFGFFSSLSAIDLNSGALRKADLLVAHDLEADARRLSVLRIGQRQVRQVHGGSLGDVPAFLLCRLLLVRLTMWMPRTSARSWVLRTSI